MKHILFAALLISLFASCMRKVTIGRGESTSETRTVGSFTRIDLSTPVDAEIHVKEGAQTSVQISGYKNLITNIKTQVVGKTLKVFTDDMIQLDTDKDIVLEVTVGSLDAIEINGAADVNTTGTMKGDNVEIKISGAGNIILDEVQAGSFTAKISGAGDITIGRGQVSKSAYAISGAGSIKSFGVTSNDVSAKVSGSGDMEVTAVKALDAHVSGSGNIRYKGHPALTSKTSGLGEIIAAE
ncbi:MAG: DUF2807 domain-containing protein [Sphingobacteriales bacterium]|nr:MAG: DUF2807 domain-containing protein [Sphingobacteriales bacterium]